MLLESLVALSLGVSQANFENSKPVPAETYAQLDVGCASFIYTDPRKQLLVTPFVFEKANVSVGLGGGIEWNDALADWRAVMVLGAWYDLYLYRQKAPDSVSLGARVGYARTDTGNRSRTASDVLYAGLVFTP